MLKVWCSFNVSGRHLELLVFYPTEWNIIYVNPLGENATRIKAILKAWKIVANKYENEVSQGAWTCTLRPHIRQADGHSCGAFVIEVSIYVPYIEP